MPDWVLVVDDDSGMAAVVADRLETIGLAATIANDAVQAVIQAESISPILVIIDMQMPGYGSGADAIRAMRGHPRLKGTPIIVFTGMDLGEAAKMLPPDPLVKIMGKPMDWTLMLGTIRELLEKTGRAGAITAPAPVSPLPGATPPPVEEAPLNRAVAGPAPVPVSEAVGPARSSASKPPAKKPRVLVIEDEYSIRELIAVGLKDLYEVFIAQDGKEGVAITQKERPELILCDVLMPKITGAEVLRMLQVDPVLFRIPVVMMSGATLDEATHAMFKLHPNVRRWLRKPFDIPSLRDAVAEALTGAVPTKPAPVAGRKYKILMVEDDLPLFQFLSLAMHRDDEVIRVMDGLQALEQLKAVKPDLIMADLMMPRMSGIELLRAIQTDPSRRDIPVIVLTAMHPQPGQIEIMRKDFPNLKFLLEKPCPLKKLQGAVQSILPR